MRISAVGEHPRRLIGLWLLALAVMVLVNVVLGGLTRLTGSGLSMVEWQPLTLMPPLDAAAWQEMFGKYQQSPQFRLLNGQMTLDGFQAIFWLEYVHRLWGRLLGLAFLLPFILFVAQGRIARREIPALLLLFLLGAGQGVLGWAMVASGLRDRPEVSHYRLAAHLFAALLLYGALLWTGFNRLDPPPLLAASNRLLNSLRRHLRLLLVALAVTIPAGALVAGLHAGLIYNSFPLMGDQVLADDALDLSPGWLNFFANPAMVQFDHRCLALLSWLLAMSVLPAALQPSLPVGLRWKLALVPALACLQVALGIGTLLYVVPLPLAATHQVTAFLLFGASLYSLNQLKARAAPAR